jgi:hypothetical protein
MKRLILASSPFQEKVVRMNNWLMREKYSQIDQNLFSQLIDNLSVKQDHGVVLKRFGSKFDGGYVLADLKMSYSKLVSFGVGDNIDFEESLGGFVGEIDLYDHTVLQPPIYLAEATFFRIGLSDVCNDGFVDLASVTREDSNDLLLKIDVEGDEWKSLSNVDPKYLKPYAQIVLELHGLHRIHVKESLELYLSVLEILHMHHELLFVHGNNWSQVGVINGHLLPDVLEVTFVRRDLLVTGYQDRKTLENLGSPNNPNVADFKLTF